MRSSYSFVLGLALSLQPTSGAWAQTEIETETAPPSSLSDGRVRTAFYFQFGQSNAVGVTPLSQLPASIDHSADPRPIYEVHVVSGSGEASVHRLRNLNYIRTAGETVTDTIDGSVKGPRGETVVLGTAKALDSTLSSFVGVAESIKAGYNTSHSKVIFMKAAQGGTYLSAQDPYAAPNTGGGVYRNARRAIRGWMRGFVDGEVKAGRVVDMQIAKLDQGGAEVVEAQRNGVLVSDRMLGWSALLRKKIYPYYVEKFGVSFPLLIPQMLPIRTANDPAAPLVPQNEAQNAIEEGACRYTVNIDANGGVIDIVDNGASPTRLNTAYFMKHGRTERSLTEVHTSYALARIFGIARTNIQRLIQPGDQGLTRYRITRIAPVIMEHRLGLVVPMGIDIDISVDEPAKVAFLAHPAGTFPPSVAAIKANGKTVFVSNDINGNAMLQTFTISAQPNTAYDVYAVAFDAKYGHTGYVRKVATRVTTPAL